MLHALLVCSTKKINLSCCSKVLEELKIEHSEKEEFIPLIKEFDGEYSVEFKHPMTKKNYISNIIQVFADKVLIINLFAEQQAITTLSQIAGSRLYVVTNENKLIMVEG